MIIEIMNYDYTNYNTEVGSRIRQTRESLHMTREQFSELCDISDSFLAAVELGKKSITLKTLHKICSSTNANPEYIVFGSSDNGISDNIISLIASIPIDKRESALVILREYAKAVNTEYVTVQHPVKS